MLDPAGRRAKLVMFDAEGNTVAEMGSDEHGGGIDIFDPATGKTRAIRVGGN